VGDSDFIRLDDDSRGANVEVGWRCVEPYDLLQVGEAVDSDARQISEVTVRWVVGNEARLDRCHTDEWDALGPQPEEVVGDP